MATDLKERLVDYVQDAHAMERDSLMMLKSMAKTTADPEMQHLIEHHIGETEQHEARLKERLETLGADTSKVRETGVLLGSMFKGVLDQMRTDKPGRNARDGYVTEALEIAAYELLQRYAERAGDNQTADIARMNLKDEKAMAEKLSGTWDKVIDLTLEEAETTS